MGLDHANNVGIDYDLGLHLLAYNEGKFLCSPLMMVDWRKYSWPLYHPVLVEVLPEQTSAHKMPDWFQEQTNKVKKFYIKV